MIAFSAQDGQPVAVSPQAVRHVRPASGDQTAIYSSSGAALFVQEPFDTVLTRLREADGGAEAYLFRTGVR